MNLFKINTNFKNYKFLIRDKSLLEILPYILLILVFMGILSLFIKNQIYNIIYSSVGALLFSFCIVYDTQLIIGGKHKYSYDVNDHVFAALSLYLDIINLFTYLLRII